MTYWYDNRLYNQPVNNPDKEVDSFLKRYEAQAGLSKHKQYYRRRPVSYRDWLHDGANIPFHQEVDREPMVEMYIPTHRFQELVEKEQWYRRLEEETDYYKKIVNQYREDERVRDKNPALQKAWRNYLTLLELAR